MLERFAFGFQRVGMLCDGFVLVAPELFFILRRGQRADRVSSQTAAWCRKFALCPTDIMSAKRRRKCAVSATLGVSGIMEVSVMKRAFLKRRSAMVETERAASRGRTSNAIEIVIRNSVSQTRGGFSRSAAAKIGRRHRNRLENSKPDARFGEADGDGAAMGLNLVDDPERARGWPRQDAWRAIANKAGISDGRINRKDDSDVPAAASYLESLNPEQRRAVEHGVVPTVTAGRLAAVGDCRRRIRQDQHAWRTGSPI